MKKFHLVIFLACVWAGPALADLVDGAGAYHRGDYEQAYNTMRSIAETSEDGLAQYYVAMMYLQGQGVGQSYDEAAKWFRKAAEQRIKQAQYRLAELYMSGRGVPRDYEYAYAWYRTGAEHRHRKSIDALPAARDKLSAGELEEAEKLSRRLIKQFGPQAGQAEKSQVTNK